MINTKNNLYKFTKGLTLLYVEEDSDTIKSNLSLFKKYFNEIIIAKKPEKALRKLKKYDVDILISEISFINFDGIKFFKKIKRLNKNIIKIILSNENRSSIFEKSINLSINAYIVKPLKKKKLKKILNNSIPEYLVYKKDKSNIKLLEQYQEIVDKNTIVSKTNPDGIITYVNDNFSKISGYTKKELIGKSHNIVRHPDNSKEMFRDMWDTIKNKKEEWSGIIKNRTKSGTSYYVKSTITPIFDKNGNIIEYIGVRNIVNSIISDKKHLIEKIATSDISLLVLIQIEEFEVLDKFYNTKTINEIENVFGLELLKYLPNGYLFDNIFNIENGRFVLLTDFFNYLNSGQNIIEYLNTFVKTVNKSMLIIDEIEYDLNIVVSYSFGKENLYEDAKCGLDEVLAKNDLIKNANDTSIKEQSKAKNNLEIMKIVKIALENYKIVSFFQPIINNKTREIEKYESLVRLIDEKGKILTPFHFLEISRKSNYYNKITMRVLENSFKILDIINTKLSINISFSDIEKEETRNKIFELISLYEKDSNRIIFELLENEEIKDFQVVKNFIRKVKKQGVKIAIDDFGAGYSNFERLSDFEPDILKIDGSLIRNIATSGYSRNIVETIVAFAKKQNIQTIAEFVENKEIFDILNVIGIDYSQGYYFGKPENLCS